MNTNMVIVSASMDIMHLLRINNATCSALLDALPVLVYLLAQSAIPLIDTRSTPVLAHAISRLPAPMEERQDQTK